MIGEDRSCKLIQRAPFPKEPINGAAKLREHLLDSPSPMIIEAARLRFASLLKPTDGLSGEAALTSHKVRLIAEGVGWWRKMKSQQRR